MMGVGQALTEGTQYGDDAKQRNTGLLEYKLQTAADANDPHRVHRDPGSERRTVRGQGSGRGPERPDRRSDRQRCCEAGGHARAPAADDRRTGLDDERRDVVVSFTIATTVDEALVALGAGLA